MVKDRRSEATHRTADVGGRVLGRQWKDSSRQPSAAGRTFYIRVAGV